MKCSLSSFNGQIRWLHSAFMAHDINHHAAIIMSRADCFLLESQTRNITKLYENNLNVINNQIEKISKITKNILKHSKKISINFAEFDLIKLINHSFEMLELVIKKRKINLV